MISDYIEYFLSIICTIICTCFLPSYNSSRQIDVRNFIPRRNWRYEIFNYWCGIKTCLLYYVNRNRRIVCLIWRTDMSYVILFKHIAHINYTLLLISRGYSFRYIDFFMHDTCISTWMSSFCLTGWHLNSGNCFTCITPVYQTIKNTEKNKAPKESSKQKIAKRCSLGLIEPVHGW